MTPAAHDPADVHGPHALADGRDTHGGPPRADGRDTHGGHPRAGARGRTVLVMAKAPVPGRVKTRLCPPLSPAAAARLAEAALADTLDAVLACAADRRVLVLDGAPGPWLPSGVEVIPQRGAGLAERLAGAWAAPLERATLQIGMDTPQVTAALLDLGFALLEAPGADAVLGLASDGGWWAIGMRRPDPQVFDGVPMSDPTTGAAQLAALARRGHRVRLLPLLRDVDTVGDLRPVALDCATGSRFVSTAGELGLLPDTVVRSEGPGAPPGPVTPSGPGTPIGSGAPSERSAACASW